MAITLGWEIFTSSPLAYKTVDFKEVVSDLFYHGSTLEERECMKNEALGIALKHNNSLKTFPCAIKKHYAIH